MQPLTRLRVAIARSYAAFLALAFIFGTLWASPSAPITWWPALILTGLIALCFMAHGAGLHLGYMALKESARKATSGG